MKKAEDRVKLPQMELIPREERELQEIRYAGYVEKMYGREGRAHGR